MLKWTFCTEDLLLHHLFFVSSAHYCPHMAPSGTCKLHLLKKTVHIVDTAEIFQFYLYYLLFIHLMYGSSETQYRWTNIIRFPSFRLSISIIISFEQLALKS